MKRKNTKLKKTKKGKIESAKITNTKHQDTNHKDTNHTDSYVSKVKSRSTIFETTYTNHIFDTNHMFDTYHTNQQPTLKEIHTGNTGNSDGEVVGDVELGRKVMITKINHSHTHTPLTHTPLTQRHHTQNHHTLTHHTEVQNPHTQAHHTQTHHTQSHHTTNHTTNHIETCQSLHNMETDSVDWEGVDHEGVCGHSDSSARRKGERGVERVAVRGREKRKSERRESERKRYSRMKEIYVAFSLIWALLNLTAVFHYLTHTHSTHSILGESTVYIPNNVDSILHTPNNSSSKLYAVHTSNHQTYELTSPHNSPHNILDLANWPISPISNFFTFLQNWYLEWMYSHPWQFPLQFVITGVQAGLVPCEYIGKLEDENTDYGPHKNNQYNNDHNNHHKNTHTHNNQHNNQNNTYTHSNHDHSRHSLIFNNPLQRDSCNQKHSRNERDSHKLEKQRRQGEREKKTTISKIQAVQSIEINTTPTWCETTFSIKQERDSKTDKRLEIDAGKGNQTQCNSNITLGILKRKLNIEKKKVTKNLDATIVQEQEVLNGLDIPQTSPSLRHSMLNKTSPSLRHSMFNENDHSHLHSHSHSHSLDNGVKEHKDLGEASSVSSTSSTSSTSNHIQHIFTHRNHLQSDGYFSLEKDTLSSSPLTVMEAQLSTSPPAVIALNETESSTDPPPFSFSSASPPPTPFSLATSHKVILYIAEFLGTAGYSITASMMSIERGLNMVSIIIISIITSLGGGIIRDILLGRFPPVNLLNTPCISISTITSIIVFGIIHKNKKKKKKNFLKLVFFLETVDSFALGCWCVVAVQISSDYGLQNNPLLCCILAVVNCIGGSISRDVLSNEFPGVLRDLYSLIAFMGAIIFYSIRNVMYEELAAILTLVVVIVARFITSQFEIALPVITGFSLTSGFEEDVTNENEELQDELTVNTAVIAGVRKRKNEDILESDSEDSEEDSDSEDSQREDEGDELVDRRRTLVCPITTCSKSLLSLEGLGNNCVLEAGQSENTTSTGIQMTAVENEPIRLVTVGGSEGPVYTEESTLVNESYVTETNESYVMGMNGSYVTEKTSVEKVGLRCVIGLPNSDIGLSGGSEVKICHDVHLGEEKKMTDLDLY